jgi:hypothetical protein
MGGYQDRDREIVDYQLYYLDNFDFCVRGPEPQKLEENKYFVCLGAAQTFGCFTEKPYPVLLQEKINMQSLNLGFAGAGPYFFLRNKDFLIKYINNAKFAVIQVMSGRSESNSLFDSGGLEYLTRRSDGVKIGAQQAYDEVLRNYDKKYVKELIAETRLNWVNNYKLLLEEIKIPKVLFWFSTRKSYYTEIYLCKKYAGIPAFFGKSNAGALFGKFPQLVNPEMINQIRQYSDEYVECISKRGMPQVLISRFTGKPITIDPGLARKDLGNGKRQKYNNYYPSPEMHIDAANALEKVCKKYGIN